MNGWGPQVIRLPAADDLLGHSHSTGLKAITLKMQTRALLVMASLCVTHHWAHASRPTPSHAGLQTLSLPGNHLPQLPSALLDATRLQRLDLWGNKFMFPSETELRQLLHVLPNLQWLNLDDTGIARASAEALKAAAAARGMTVLLPDFRGRGWSDEGYSSSDSDSSDDGCPRYSWAGCAYASR